MESLTVALDNRSYGICIGTGTLSEVGLTLKACNVKGRACVVTNSTVGSLYYDAVRTSLENAGYHVVCIEIPDGEQFKNSETLGYIYDGLIDAGIDRTSFIVALGGGVVGDIAGYAAATYLRGIPFVQVPTTLLAQVDSSVGGKTGINHRKGKNLIGAFYQPRQVIIDVAVLETLPLREYASGLAEVIKYGVVLDGALFNYLVSNVDRLLERDKDCLRYVVKCCCELKAKVVASDEREAGERAVLNFGHTIGHAVENLTGYTEYTHGEAVAIGMVAASRYSESKGFATSQHTQRIVELLVRLGLPVVLPQFDISRYVETIRRDKKATAGGITFVCNKGIGEFCFTRDTDPSEIIKGV